MNRTAAVIIAITLSLGIVACDGEADPLSATIPPTVSEAPPITDTVEPAVEETVSQESARRSAESYLAFAAFSRQGLIDQLEFEGFSTEEATFGVDSVGL